VDFITSLKLDIIYQGKGYTCGGGRFEVTDYALEFFGLIESIKVWEVLSDIFVLDYRYIPFTLQAIYQYA
jgi:hypothetical protein